MAVDSTPVSSCNEKLDGAEEKPTEGLKRSAGSTELHLTIDEDLGKNKAVSPSASDIVRGVGTEQIASSNSSNVFINNGQ